MALHLCRQLIKTKNYEKENNDYQSINASHG